MATGDYRGAFEYENVCSDLFFAKGWEKGKTLTISGFGSSVPPRGKKRGLYLEYEEIEGLKHWIAKADIADVLAKRFNTVKVKEWVGKKITLCVVPCPHFGDRQPWMLRLKGDSK